MNTFKAGGHTWLCEVTLGAVGRVKSHTGIELDQVPYDVTIIDKLTSDLILLVNVVYCIVQPQAEQRGITDEQFGEMLAGDGIEEMQAAFFDGLIAFFPKRHREMLQKILQKGREVQDLAARKAMTILDETDAETLLRNAMNSVVRSELILDRLPSGN